MNLETPLKPAECLERLRRISEPVRLFNDPSRRDRAPLVMKEKGLEVLLFRNTWYNNSLRPILRLRLEPSGSGTLLSGRFEISPVNFWLLAVWYGVLFYILFFLSPAPGADPGEVFRFALNTGLGLGTPALVWALGTFLARGEKAYLMDALAEALKADR